MVVSHGDGPATGGASEGAPLSVVVTPEMIEAGARVLSENVIDLADGFLASPSVVKEIYLAMAQCDPECR